MGKFAKLAEGTHLQVGSHKVTILQYLSEGGFAHIYKVKIDPEEERSDIACLKRVIVPDKNGLNTLRKEVDVMKVLRHGKNIVKYYDSHAERLPDGTYQVLVLMELCPNKSLLDFMNERIKTKLSELEILKIMLDISLGIYEMHKLKMIHRDIKIENVLIDANNDFKLCDFGSTSSPLMPPKDQQEFQVLSHDILYQTTPQYRSPEMIDLYRGFPIDEKSDIWALGCFLYKLCYYTTPFEANGDIAILHASFQFLPAPIYSGDLKNLIIIMLQENPLFRPNIIQVLMLVSTILKVDFHELGVEDFYNVGPYNFQALHEYQRQKQAELMKQQQIYYQQQQQAAQQLNQQPSMLSRNVSGANLTNQAQDHQDNLTQAERATQELDTDQKKYTQPQIIDESKPISKTDVVKPDSIADKYEFEAGDDITAGDDNVSFSDLENLDNVEERYPSLEDLLDNPKMSDKETSLSRKQSDSRKSPIPIIQSHAKFIAPQLPTKPIVLTSTELNTLTSEELKEYNAQHETYQAQNAHYQHYILQEHQHNEFSDKQAPYALYSSPNTGKGVSNLIDSSAKNAAVLPELENKEAWEKLHSNIRRSAEKLADDIFAGGNHSQQNTAHIASQGVKSDYHESSLDEDKSKELREENLAKLPTEEPISFKDTVPELIRDQNFDKKEAIEKSDDQQSRKCAPIDDISENVIETVSPGQQYDKDTIHQNINQNTSQKEALYKQTLDSTSNTPNSHNASISAGRPRPLANSSQFSSTSSVHSQNQHPFFSSLNKKFNTTSQPERKNANPWSEYTIPTSSPPVTKTTSQDESINGIPSLSNASSPPVALKSQAYNNHNNIPLGEHFKTMSLSDSSKFDIKGPTNELSLEPNLIDLEVGLDSSSSASGTPGATPTLQPKNRDNTRLDNEPSLVDLVNPETIDDKSAKLAYKKRISSIQNPSNFSFQEEVIDFASDDENPENGSKMNRLSIRNSLKKPKVSRKSSEHKRSDGSQESKKRLSFFGGNSSGNGS